jgi:FMN phosphatase YigB (HAD superfamily)
MIRAVLFDLDNTLITNPSDEFVPAYLRALGAHLAALVPPERLVSELLRCVRLMLENTDPTRTLKEVFWAELLPALDVPEADLFPLVENFYAEVYGRLRDYTAPRPDAPRAVRAAFRAGCDVVIATNPLYPATAILHRLAWAGIPADEYPYALVTSYENMHAGKPRPEYFREVVDRIGRRPAECLMVGDDLAQDMIAQSVGLRTYWITDGVAEVPAHVEADAWGTLAAFADWAERGGLEQL